MENKTKTQIWKPVRFARLTRLNHLLYQGEQLTADKRAICKAVDDNSEVTPKIVSFEFFN